MTTRGHRISTAIVAGVCLTLAGCSGESATGWIPRDGTISGVITVTAPLPAPPARAGSAVAGGPRALGLRAPPMLAALARRAP
ncbi:MAG TPA: hypothetical protein VJN39_11085, partial [Gemmatimonadales bacterium]|nr:hypothetical protein [Gemmatimonadales bacterium]